MDLATWHKDLFHTNVECDLYGDDCIVAQRAAQEAEDTLRVTLAQQ